MAGAPPADRDRAKETMSGQLTARICTIAMAAALSCNFARAAPQQQPPAGGAPHDPLLNLRQRADAANGGTRAKLFTELARAEIKLADEQFTSGSADTAQKQVASALEHATVATDAAVQSGKRLKETEIELRKLQRRTDELARSVSFDDRAPVEAAVKQLEHLRARLLQRMFGKEKS